MKTLKRFDTAGMLIYIVLAIYALLCILPMFLTVMVSISDENSIIRHGYQLIPEHFSLEAYRTLLNNKTVLLKSYLVTITVTVVGSLIAVIITAMAAYTLSNPNVKYRAGLNLYFFITLLFNGGLVPWYIMCKKLGLVDNLFALIVPMLLFNAFNMFLVRNFMEALPNALRESAYMDGANDVRIAFQIYLPLCVPVLATILLFYALAYWNDWFNAIMLVDDKSLYPLQYVLFKIRSNIEMLSMIPAGASSQYTAPAESAKMATVVITLGPIVFLYPFLQRYFVKGLIVGSVKG
ncbi:carbohydrate ABC transporter permease [Paenibacillus alginolyticus]|uniref:Carbohydrate ABC transporter permease n=1 Tax=Paenibacillus alginolyticus TaxID=59839 RepID=A0ABT4GM04_9BACL|nr:carbohydrate ABC transporter permease [Paenibacillus alginolyticus]MCY9669613.1 carbohydrate ABC transporter permease [Paenibacillus alginolyticus]MCY9697180.1 carbohydrate ABC transporter permease [Paenibacillus alginolyticus]MEC0145369.1 carbohydrate ABC transporter permease [Paenibacillus alginolyticus]